MSTGRPSNELIAHVARGTPPEIIRPRFPLSSASGHRFARKASGRRREEFPANSPEKIAGFPNHLLTEVFLPCTAIDRRFQAYLTRNGPKIFAASSLSMTESLPRRISAQKAESFSTHFIFQYGQTAGCRPLRNIALAVFLSGFPILAVRSVTGRRQRWDGQERSTPNPLSARFHSKERLLQQRAVLRRPTNEGRRHYRGDTWIFLFSEYEVPPLGAHDRSIFIRRIKPPQALPNMKQEASERR